MSGHLTMLQLDEVAAGLRAEDEHLRSCEHCRNRLADVRAARARVESDPRFERTRQRLRTGEPTGRRPWWLVLAPVAAVALVVVLLSSPREQRDGVRAKGSPRLELVSTEGTAVARPEVGGTVLLRVSSAGSPFVLVVGIEPSGDVTQVWPPAQGRSGAMPGDGLLPPAFRVTPGALALVALFSDVPLDVATVSTSWSGNLRAATDRPLMDRVRDLPPVPGEAARATTRLSPGGEE